MKSRQGNVNVNVLSSFVHNEHTLPSIVMYIYMAHGLTKPKQVYIFGNTINLYSSDVPGCWAGTKPPEGGN